MSLRTSAVLIALLWLLLYVRLGSFMVQELHMNDFGKFYYSAALFLEGRNMYAPSPATEIPLTETESRQFLNLNPPHFHLLVLPFAALSPGVALLVWTVLSVGALIVSLRLIASELRIRWTRGRILWTVFALIVCSTTGAIIVTGQLTFLLLVPVTLAWISARRGNWDRAAVCLGIGASVKPFLGIFLVYLVLARRLRPVGIMIATGLTCALAGLAVFGWSAYAEWLGGLSTVNWTWASMNGALAGVVARAFAAESPFYTPFVQMPSIVAPITNLVAAVLTVLSLAWVLREDGDGTDRTFCGLLLTAQLVSPLGWIYYLPLAVGPAVAIWQSSRRRPDRLRDALIFLSVPGLVVPFVLTTLWTDSPWAGVTIGSIYAWTTLCLWGSVMVESRAVRQAHSTIEVTVGPGAHAH